MCAEQPESTGKGKGGRTAASKVWTPGDVEATAIHVVCDRGALI